MILPAGTLLGSGRFPGPAAASGGAVAGVTCRCVCLRLTLCGRQLGPDLLRIGLDPSLLQGLLAGGVRGAVRVVPVNIGECVNDINGLPLEETINNME